jgi:hypothetical protein
LRATTSRHCTKKFQRRLTWINPYGIVKNFREQKLLRAYIMHGRPDVFVGYASDFSRTRGISGVRVAVSRLEPAAILRLPRGSAGLR